MGAGYKPVAEPSAEGDHYAIDYDGFGERDLPVNVYSKAPIVIGKGAQFPPAPVTKSELSAAIQRVQS